MHQSSAASTYADFTAGKTIPLGPKTFTAEEIIEFAAEFDPQPFHLDIEAGKASVLGGLAASGWHITATLMRMMCDAFLKHSTSQGSPGLEYVKWLKPVLAGDTLTGVSTVVESRISGSHPDLGIVRLNHQLTNQNGILICEAQGAIFMQLAAQE